MEASSPQPQLDPPEDVPITRPRNATKASVAVAWRDGRQVVVKSVQRDGTWLQRRFAGWLLGRETAALRRLAGCAHVPALLESSRTHLVTAFVPGTMIRELDVTLITPEIMDAVRAALADLHARDVGHGDLGPKDILVGDDGHVVLLDFATASWPGRPALVWRLMLPLWKRRDAARVERLAHRYERRRERELKRRAEA